MDVLAVFATIVGLAAWMGSSVFLTFFVSPAVRVKLTPGKVAEVMDLVHSRYYWTGFVSAIVMLMGGGGALFNEQLRVPTITFMGLTALALAFSLYAWLVLLPRTVSLRQRLQSSAGSTENFVVAERYDQAMRLSAYFNIMVLLLLLGAAAALATLLLESTPDLLDPSGAGQGVQVPDPK